MEDLTKLDLYDLLGVAHDATPKDIKTAYRKNALKCHPDKNPDNPAAAQLFHQLSRALEILTDGAAKDAYDKIWKARKAAEIRNRQLDSKRKKLKEDLEQRERAAELQNQQEYDPADASKKLQAEVERLRKEGSRQLEEEVRIMKEQLKAEMERLNLAEETDGTTHLPNDGSSQKTPANASEEKDDGEASLPRLKIQWKQSKSEPATRYTYDSLMQRFSKYGEITGLVMSSKSRALLEFANLEAAETALQNEIGFEDSPLRIAWINRPNLAGTTPAKENAVPKDRVKVADSVNAGPCITLPIPQKSAGGERDYENIVLMKLRQAQERKRLIEQMEKDDLGET